MFSHHHPWYGTHDYPCACDDAQTNVDDDRVRDGDGVESDGNGWCDDGNVLKNKKKWRRLKYVTVLLPFLI